MNKKYIYVGGGLIVFGLGVYVVNKFGFNLGKIKDNFLNGSLFDGETDKQELERMDKELKKKVSSGEKGSYTVDEYREGANKLETALTGLGNNIVAVIEIFDALKNEVDYLQLYKFYGNRQNENMNEALKNDFLEIRNMHQVFSKTGVISTLSMFTVADVVRVILRRKNINVPI